MTGIICTAPSSATATEACRGNVLVSGSYGGEYNAWHAAKWGLRGVILNDAGVGKDNAGIRGLDYLDNVGLPAATADAQTCHIGDGDHMLSVGRISFVNAAARKLGCAPGESVQVCARRMTEAPVIHAALPAIGGGKRYLLSEVSVRRPVICLDAAPMLESADTGSIVITGSHAALFRGRPDDVIKVDVGGIFFSDAGVGLDNAGIARLPTLDARRIPAGTASAASAAIGDARAIYRDGIVSHLNATAINMGLHVDMTIRQAVAKLIQELDPTATRHRGQ
jgi:hypothetical protein